MFRPLVTLWAVLLMLPGVAPGQQARLETPHAAASSAATASIPEIPFERFTLKNGLTLIVHEDHKAPVVAVNVWYHVGSKDETPGKTGLAHLFEHLMFGGSEHFDQDYIKALETLGATELNGTTDQDRTNYFQTVPVSALDRVLWLESDRMGHLLGSLTQAKLDRQRAVVQNEKREWEDMPYGKADNLIAESTFPAGHPYSWDPIGSMADLDAATLEDAKEWFRNHYGAANATLVVAGDVRAGEVREKVERYFGHIPPGAPRARHGAWVPRHSGERRQVMQDRVPQPRIYKVWNLPPYGTVEAAHLSLAVSILAGYPGSRLRKKLVLEDRTATEARAVFEAREIVGQAKLIITALRSSDLPAVEGVVNREIARLAADGPTGAELEAAKTRSRADLLRGMERVGGFEGKSDLLARGQVMFGDPNRPAAIRRWVEAASAEDVRDAVRRWMTDGSYVLEVQPFPDHEAASASIDRSRLPPVGPIPDAPLAAPERAKLSNGLNVVLARRTSVPLVDMTLVLDAGFAADAPDAPGVGTMVMGMLDEGTANRTAQQIADDVSAVGGRLSTWASPDASYIRIAALKDKVDGALDVMADVVLNPAFRQSDLDRVKQATLATIKQEMVDPYGLAVRVLPPLLYGPKHAYSQPLTGSGTEDSVARATPEMLSTFHRTWFKPNNATLMAVGDITMEELKPRLEAVFGRWAPGTTPVKPAEPGASRTKPTIYILDRPRAEQSILFAGQLVPPKTHADDVPFEAFNDAFGYAFGSRINMNLREDKHWSYGAFSFTFNSRGDRMWVAMAPVQADKTAEAMAELSKEIRSAVGDRPLTAEEVSESRDRQIRSLAGRWETAHDVFHALDEIVTLGLPDDYYAAYPKKLRAVTPETANSAAKKFIHPDQLVWVVVGDRQKIEPVIRALNLGEVQLLEPEGAALTARAQEGAKVR